MAGIDPDVPIGTVKSMEEQVSASLTVQRLLSTLLMAFGSMALLLGSIGVYGLMAYTVQLRRREIGLRIAMGAPRSAVSGLVVRQAMVLGAAGVTLGLFGSVAAGRVLEGFLFGVSSTDLTTLAAVSATVLGVTALASYGPARRAASVDPLTTLKEE
jgi:ABC-type antimicrobial peptide transport system permease subunit